MSAKHIRNTGDLMRFRAGIRIDCPHCGAARTLSGLETVQALGVTGWEEAEARLKCGRCGGKGAKITVLPPV
jgi:DNA-directed RNA polymerase subunit RPC12/RpoP